MLPTAGVTGRQSFAVDAFGAGGLVAQGEAGPPGFRDGAEFGAGVDLGGGVEAIPVADGFFEGGFGAGLGGAVAFDGAYDSVVVAEAASGSPRRTRTSGPDFACGADREWWSSHECPRSYSRFTMLNVKMRRSTMNTDLADLAAHSVFGRVRAGEDVKICLFRQVIGSGPIGGAFTQLRGHFGGPFVVPSAVLARLARVARGFDGALPSVGDTVPAVAVRIDVSAFRDSPTAGLCGC